MLKSYLYLTAIALLSALSISHAQTSPNEIKYQDTTQPNRIAYTAHSALFDPHGQRIQPSVNELESWLDQQFRAASASPNVETQRRIKEMLSSARKLNLADPVVQSIILEALAIEERVPSFVHLAQLNHTIRREWFRNTLDRETFRQGFDAIHGLPVDLRSKLVELNLIGKNQQALGDIPAGEDYVALCRNEGVPTPPAWEAPNGMSRGDWDFEGELNTNLLDFGDPTEVWSFRSNSPEGVCIALPRFSSTSSDLIDETGIICLGTETGNACFYDLVNLEADKTYGIDEFQAGANLMSGGICSDCHAGENPFIVHPDETLDLGAEIRSPVWHVPLVKPSWPQNPGPSNILDLIDLPAGQRECKDCHHTNFAGRLPDVNALNLATFATSLNQSGISLYCKMVLKRALSGFPNPSGTQGPTMGLTPMGELDEAFDTHRNAMLALCQQEVPPPGQVPVPDDDREIVSPPLIGPLYACAESVEVRGAIHNAEVVLTINGADLSPVIADSSESIQFAVLPLVKGDLVSARQSIDGQMKSSPTLEVISHLDDYPDGLPAPEIDPHLVHQCGHTIAIRHVEGAIVSVTVNGGDDIRFTNGGDWTYVRPGKSPFDLDDTFVAQQFMCEDASALSDSVTAVAPPNPMPTPMLDPNPPLVDQPYLAISSLANGALTVVEENGTGQVASFSSAINRHPEVNVENGLGRLVQAGDQFQIVSTLCEDVKFEPEPARPCESLPVPHIETPIVGKMSITVTDYVPGARILVWDESDAKIGDGSGTEVGLTRSIVQGDILTVAQRLGNCMSEEAYQVAAVCISEKDCDLD
ncbi:MAG: hypothetical protein KTR35_21005 [Gammaproteobacteria bacterium]|nr:hypothetical protein [Gammaproteobacteria bacterium]